MAGERISRENIKTTQGFLHCILFRNDHENLLEILLKQQNFTGEQVKKIYHSSMSTEHKIRREQQQKKQGIPINFSLHNINSN